MILGANILGESILASSQNYGDGSVVVILPDVTATANPGPILVIGSRQPVKGSQGYNQKVGPGPSITTPVDVFPETIRAIALLGNAYAQARVNLNELSCLTYLPEAIAGIKIGTLEVETPEVPMDDEADMIFIIEFLQSSLVYEEDRGNRLRLE